MAKIKISNNEEKINPLLKTVNTTPQVNVNTDGKTQQINLLKSRVLVNIDGEGGTIPKLPDPLKMEYGRLAINYAKGYETLSTKNDNDEIVEFKTIDYINSLIKNAVGNLHGLETASIKNQIINDGIQSDLKLSTVSGNTLNINTDGLYTTFDLTYDTGILRLTAPNNVVKTVNLPLESFLIAGGYYEEYYDFKHQLHKKVIVLIVRNEKGEDEEIIIPISDLVNIYTFIGDGRSIKVVTVPTVVGTNNYDVQISLIRSPKPNNIFENTVDGAFVEDFRPFIEDAVSQSGEKWKKYIDDQDLIFQKLAEQDATDKANKALVEAQAYSDVLDKLVMHLSGGTFVGEVQYANGSTNTFLNGATNTLAQGSVTKYDAGANVILDKDVQMNWGTYFLGVDDFGRWDNMMPTSGGVFTGMVQFQHNSSLVFEHDAQQTFKNGSFLNFEGGSIVIHKINAVETYQSGSIVNHSNGSNDNYESGSTLTHQLGSIETYSPGSNSTYQNGAVNTFEVGASNIYNSASEIHKGNATVAYNNNSSVSFNNTAKQTFNRTTKQIFECDSEQIFKCTSKQTFIDDSISSFSGTSKQIFELGTSTNFNNGAESNFNFGSHENFNSGATTNYNNGSSLMFNAGAVTTHSGDTTNFNKDSVINLNSGATQNVKTGGKIIYNGGNQDFNTNAISTFNCDSEQIFKCNSKQNYTENSTNNFNGSSQQHFYTGSISEFHAGSELKFDLGSNETHQSGSTNTYVTGSVIDMNGGTQNFNCDSQVILKCNSQQNFTENSTSNFNGSSVQNFNNNTHQNFNSGSTQEFFQGSNQIFHTGSNDKHEAGSTSIYQNGSSLMFNAGAVTTHSGDTTNFNKDSVINLNSGATQNVQSGASLNFEYGSNLEFTCQDGSKSQIDCATINHWNNSTDVETNPDSIKHWVIAYVKDYVDDKLGDLVTDLTKEYMPITGGTFTGGINFANHGIAGTLTGVSFENNVPMNIHSSHVDFYDGVTKFNNSAVQAVQFDCPVEMLRNTTIFNGTITNSLITNVGATTTFNGLTVFNNDTTHNRTITFPVKTGAFATNADIICRTGGATQGIANITCAGSGNFADGGYQQPSDKTIKENFEHFDCTLEQIEQLSLVYFNYIGAKGKMLGVIAQEIKNICPLLVQVQPNGILLVDYTKLSLIALKGVKLLSEKVNKQQSEIEKIKEVLNLK